MNEDKISNYSHLPYKVIGQIIDVYKDATYGDTCYAGKVDRFEFRYKDVLYRCQIRYLKRYTDWVFVKVGK